MIRIHKAHIFPVKQDQLITSYREISMINMERKAENILEAIEKELQD